jgi:hypothetical protein
MAHHDIETNKNLNFEIKFASVPYQMRAKIESVSRYPCDAAPDASPAAWHKALNQDGLWPFVFVS